MRIDRCGATGAYQRYGHGHGHNHGHGHTHRTFDAEYVDDERSHINSTSHARARPAPPTYVDGHRRYGASPMTLPSRTTTGATGASAEYSEPYEVSGVRFRFARAGSAAKVGIHADYWSVPNS